MNILWCYTDIPTPTSAISLYMCLGFS
jgi:hypothetical protein